MGSDLALARGAPSLQTELHTRPVSFLVSGEALETNSRAAPLSTSRLSRARFEPLVSKYRAGGQNSVLCGYRAPEIDLYRREAMPRESAARPLTEHHREGTSAENRVSMVHHFHLLISKVTTY